jgi:uncharacterized protein YkwD
VKRFQAITAWATALALVLPLSLFAESRTRARTDMRALALELAAVLGRGSVEVRSPRASAPRSSAPAPTRSEALSMHALVDQMNVYRSAAGLGLLRLDERLTLAAGDRIRDMYGKRYFDHVAPDGTQPFVWVSRRAYRYSSVGENLAAGYPSARQVVDGWMRSPGHRANILAPQFADVGLAVQSGFPGRERIGGPTVVALYARER